MLRVTDVIEEARERGYELEERPWPRLSIVSCSSRKRATTINRAERSCGGPLRLGLLRSFNDEDAIESSDVQRPVYRWRYADELETMPFGFETTVRTQQHAQAGGIDERQFRAVEHCITLETAHCRT